jgi:hypothetical protein
MCDKFMIAEAINNLMPQLESLNTAQQKMLLQKYVKDNTFFITNFVQK